MENSSFRTFLNSYLDVWRNSSLTDLKDIISKDYEAREVSKGEIVDFGYEEAITGWEQGFNFVKQENNQWDLNEISVIPLRQNEVLVILSATIIIDGKSLENVSLFFQTFMKNENGAWKLIRSYIEAGVPSANVGKIQFN